MEQNAKSGTSISGASTAVLVLVSMDAFSDVGAIVSITATPGCASDENDRFIGVMMPEGGRLVVRRNLAASGGRYRVVAMNMGSKVIMSFKREGEELPVPVLPGTWREIVCAQGEEMVFQA